MTWSLFFRNAFFYLIAIWDNPIFVEDLRDYIFLEINYVFVHNDNDLFLGFVF